MSLSASCVRVVVFGGLGIYCGLQAGLLVGHLTTTVRSGVRSNALARRWVGRSEGVSHVSIVRAGGAISARNGLVISSSAVFCVKCGGYDREMGCCIF